MKEPAPASSDPGYDGKRAANGEHEQLLRRHPDREYRPAHSRDSPLRRRPASRSDPAGFSR